MERFIITAADGRYLKRYVSQDIIEWSDDILESNLFLEKTHALAVAITLHCPFKIMKADVDITVKPEDTAYVSYN